MKKYRILLLFSILGMLTLCAPALTANADWVETAGGHMYTQEAAPGYVTGLKKIGNYTYYFNGQGIMQTGFQTIDKKKYYFDSLGRMKFKRFVASNGKTYFANQYTGVLLTNQWYKKRYYQADGSMAVNTWINGKYVGANGLYTGVKRNVGWITKGSQKYYYTDDGVMVKGKQTINGKLYYFDSSTGAMKKNGWFKVGKKYYYAKSNGVLLVNKWKGGKYLLSSGAAATGWTEIKGTSYLFTSAGKKCSGWVKHKKLYYYCVNGVVQKNSWVDGNKYYVTANGTKALGWLDIDGHTYYFNPSTGAKRTGCVKIGTSRYFFDANGRLSRGTWVKSSKYYASATGALLTGLQNISGSLYYFKYNGKKVTNSLKTVNSATYYFAKNGAAVKDCWVKLKSDYYYFQSDCSMVKNKWVGNWYVDLNGVRTNQTKKSGWDTVDGKKYYYDTNGSKVLGWSTISKNSYYFDPATGVMLTGLQVIGDKKYYFYSDGRMAASITIAVGAKEYTIGADGVITAEKSIKISGNTVGTQIVNFALQYIGNPYVWGGTSLTKGADCSGFVQTVFANFGIKLLRVADDQMKGPSASISSSYKRPVIVDEDSMLPGDLIFYGDANYASHVAIYIGVHNGHKSIVHASNSQPYPAGGIKITENYAYQTPVRIVRYWS